MARARQEAIQTKIIDFSLGSCSCKCRAGCPSCKSVGPRANSRNLFARDTPLPLPAYIIPAPSWRLDITLQTLTTSAAATPASIDAEKERAIFKSHLLLPSPFLPPSFSPRPPTAYLLLQPNIDRFWPCVVWFPPRNSPTERAVARPSNKSSR